MNNRGKIAITEILILVIGIVAIGYALGSEMRLISAPPGVMPAYGDNPNQITNDNTDLGGFDLPPVSGDPLTPISLTEGMYLTPATTTIPNGVGSARVLSEIAGKDASFFNLKSPLKFTLENYQRGGSKSFEVSQIWRNGDKYYFNDNGKATEITGTILKEEGIVDANGDIISSTVTAPSAAATKTSPWWGLGRTGMDGVLQGLGWALIVAGAIKLIGPMLGMGENTANALSASLGSGIFTGKLAHVLISKYAGTEGWLTQSNAGMWGVGIGVGVAVIVFLMMYKDTTTEVVTFDCKAWDAPIGGSNCDKCNKQGVLTCSEYQCRSLGQACQLLNPGTKEEKCAWIHPDDVNPPVIKEWADALTKDHKYVPETFESPGDYGVRIVNEKASDGCLKAFTPLQFGIETNEPAKCKLDYIKKPKFDDMSFFFGGSSLFAYNHTQIMSLPGSSNVTVTVENDRTYDLFVKCMDANGNYNPANFVFRFCVSPGPDTTAPLIVSTSVLNGMPISYNQTSMNLDVFVNEAADCRWSQRDQDYDVMEYPMNCRNGAVSVNAQMLYKCTTTLTGLKSEQENKFYFRCKDQPSAPENDRNKNTKSYEYKLIGTRPLYITSVKPNGTIKDATDTIKVTLEATTSAGYKDGAAICYFSETGDVGSYVAFFDSNFTHTHKQDLYLTEGEYSYKIRCIDLGGNSDDDEINFRVETDLSAPIIVRAYHSGTHLEIITDEEAECVFDNINCEYDIETGTAMTVLNENEHYTDWDTTKNYYVKCQDGYGNKPLPNACSMIIRPFQIYSVDTSGE